MEWKSRRGESPEVVGIKLSTRSVAEGTEFVRLDLCHSKVFLD